MDLARAVREALERLARQPRVREVEVFAAFNRSLFTRLNYTSHIPCNGVEEPKSTEMAGLGVQAVFDGPDGRPLIGFGSEPSDLTAGRARCGRSRRRGRPRCTIRSSAPCRARPARRGCSRPITIRGS